MRDGETPPAWSRLLQHDSQGMWGDLEAFPAQCRAAVQLAEEASLPNLTTSIRAVLTLGLGGSAIGGDMLASLLLHQAQVPVLVHRNYGLPAWVGPDTLVLAVSYSGNTEETLDAFQTAVERGAPVVAVTSGGTLAASVAEAAGAGAPVAAIGIPPGLQPRAATGYLFLPLVVTLHRLGLTDDPARSLEVTLALVDELARTFGRGAAPNPAQKLAQQLANRSIYIYGADAVGAVAAYRWQTQLNENAKVLAHAHRLPEMNHNEIVGWQSVPRLQDASQPPVAVFLRHGVEHPRNRLRLAITQELLAQRAHCQEVTVAARDPLAALLGLMYWGDVVSFYLAVLKERDPSSIQNIILLKERLAASPESEG